MANRKQIAERLENYGRWFCCCIFTAPIHTHTHTHCGHVRRTNSFSFIHDSRGHDRCISCALHFLKNCLSTANVISATEATSLFCRDLVVDSGGGDGGSGGGICLAFVPFCREWWIFLLFWHSWCIDWRRNEDKSKHATLCDVNGKQQENEHRGSLIRDHRYYYLLKIERHRCNS